MDSALYIANDYLKVYRLQQNKGSKSQRRRPFQQVSQEPTAQCGCDSIKNGADFENAWKMRQLLHNANAIVILAECGEYMRGSRKFCQRGSK